MPGMPPQVICYERADDIGFGVSGRGHPRARHPRHLSGSEPRRDPDGRAGHAREGALPARSDRRQPPLADAALSDGLIRALRLALPYEADALELPCTPPFLHKHGGLVLSIGQFNQWVGAQVMSSGLVQVWPGTPVGEPLIEGDRVVGVRLLDQGTDKQGNPEAGFMPGMDIRAALTVVGDGPVGPVGRQLDEHFGMPAGHHQRDWAVGMKMVIDLADDVELEPGTVFHTFGYPEPEIFGFLYVHPDRVASVGIFVPSWFDNPVRTSYRYLQHWMLHPYLWRYLQGGTLRSWGAKIAAGIGQARRAEACGQRLCAHRRRLRQHQRADRLRRGRGLDHRRPAGRRRARAPEGRASPSPGRTSSETYVARRRESWVESEGRVAEKARDGFQRGVVTGLIGMALAGLTKGKLALPGEPVPPYERVPSVLEVLQRQTPRRGDRAHPRRVPRQGPLGA